MPRIMSDNDVKGYFRILVGICESEWWRDVWEELRVEVFTFEDLGLSESASDAEIWRACQDQDIVLITGNRNADDPASLEVTIRQHNDAECLPVLTLADPERIARDRSHAESVVERMLEVLIDLDAVRGTGRLYLP